MNATECLEEFSNRQTYMLELICETEKALGVKLKSLRRDVEALNLLSDLEDIHWECEHQAALAREASREA
jgi:hypothetical protein